MKLSCKHFALIAILIGGFAAAQVSTGTPPYGSFGGGPFDTVNLGNLNVHFAIPVLHKAGRGVPLMYDLGYDSSIWYPTVVSGTTQWMPTANWGWMPNTLAIIGYVSTTTTAGTTINGKFCPNGQFGSKTTYTTTYAYVDVKKISHPFPGSTYETVLSGGCSSTTYGPVLTATATDGSGYSIYAPARQVGITATTRSGVIVATNVYNPNSGSGWYQDTNGNQLTANANGQYFDTLSSSTPVLTTAGSGTPTSPVTYTYAAPSGSASYQVNYTQYTVATHFAISGITEYGPTSNALVSSVQLPDGSEYQFTYEQTPGSCTPLPNTYANCVTGRMYQVILPTGGTIQYSYSGGTNNTGIYSDGSTGGLSRELITGWSGGPNGTWSYARQLVSGTPAPGSTWTTTIVDPSGNNTVINFAEDAATNTSTTVATYNFYETQRKVYQGSVSSNSCSSSNPNNCLLLTTTGCYNAHYSSCATSTVTSPISQTDYYAQPAGGQTRLSETLYNGYGLVTDDKEYDYGATTGAAPGTTKLIRETNISYAVLGNSIVNRPLNAYVYDWTSGSQVSVSSTNYGWDSGTPTPTTSTPQHVSITGARGNMTSALAYINGTTHLTKAFTYYDTGNVNVATDVNGAQTTYVYGSGSCGNSFATTVYEPLSLSRSITWNCTGAVVTQVADENQNNTSSSYTDPAYWRPSGVTDQMNNETTFWYQPNASYQYPTAVASNVTFNNGNSAVYHLAYFDSLGRPLDSQIDQTPSGSTLDTVSYSYDANGRLYSTSMPCSGGPVTTCPSSPATTQTYDALNRPLITTDGGGGTVSYTYTNNDVLQQVSGSRTFQKQFEYDGLGRLTSVCEISTTLPGKGACGQNVSQTGYLTKYTYDALGRLLKVTQNAQPGGTTQTRSFVYDWLGRMTSESNPETGNQGANGTTTYAFDSSSNCGGVPIIGCGDLAHRTDNAGNITNYTYDALHRLTDVGNSSQSTTNFAKRFRYDNSSGAFGSRPSGVSVSNTMGRLVEAATDNGGEQTPITDEWFSYDADGRMTDVFESTPSSGGYYHATASYWANGQLKTLGALNTSQSPIFPLQTYGVDAEGRPNSVTAASGQSPVSSVSYVAANGTGEPVGSLTQVTFGSLDSDSFKYDPNTGRMTQYAFTVGSTPQTATGSLGWNANGTLNQLAINDPFNSSDTQTCGYGYDDLARVSSVGCGGSWQQTFSYDAFGNIKKSGSVSWQPTYSSSNNNQYQSGWNGVSYDANGNLLNDTFNTYTWSVNGTLATANGSAITYDAFGRMAEIGGKPFVYSPAGGQALAIMQGQTLNLGYIPLPGGAFAIYNSSGLAQYNHPDWLGSARLFSTPNRTATPAMSYAPFGEGYAANGWVQFTSAGNSWTVADGDNQTGSLDDFMFRRYNPTQGRWISPDPAGLAAVDPTSPQTWNRYAYVANNPLSFVDPLGLQVGRNCNISGDPCMGGGGGDEMGGWSDASGASTGSTFEQEAADWGAYWASIGGWGTGFNPGGILTFIYGGATSGTGSADNPYRFYVSVWTPFWNPPFGPAVTNGGGAGAANNGNVAKSVTAQCLAGYNNSAAAKGIQFFSLYNLATNVKQAWADWTVLPAAKITAGYIIDKVSQAIGNTEFWSLTSGAEAPASVVVAPTAAGVGAAETAGKVAGVPTIVYATGLDALANAGCSTIGRQAAGQMTPLPPGWNP